MSVADIRRLSTAVITTVGAEQIIRNAQDRGVVTAGELAELNALAAAPSRFESAAARDHFVALLGAATGQVVPAPVVPSGPRKFVQESRPSWTATYFPMADYAGDKKGSPDSNLWAENGAADNFDKVLEKLGLPTGARDYELQPAINWLVGKQSGGYLASGTVDETNVEVTTGIDFNGDGRITAGVKEDIITHNNRFVPKGSPGNGKLDDTLGVGWWGWCDAVGAAGIMFREPVKEVEYEGVKFSPTMIKGLLSMISASQGGYTEYVGSRNDERFDAIKLKNGETVTGRIEQELRFGADPLYSGDEKELRSEFPEKIEIVKPDGTKQIIKGVDVRTISRELRREHPAAYHTKMIEWLASGRPAVMDKDDGAHLWNFNFHKLEDTNYENGLKPAWANQVDLTNGFQGPVRPDDKITYVERTVTLGASGGGSGGKENYKYWLAERDGKIVNSGWAKYSSSPDFLWRPTQAPKFTGANPRNPFIKPELVKEIYLRSLSEQDRLAEEARLAGSGPVP
jgi:hypothetical protein